MKKLLTLLLIFCFYTQSISSVTQGGYFTYAFSTEGEEEDNEPSKESERLSEELDDACNSDDGTCDYTFNGIGANKGDGLKIAWEQIVLITMAFLSTAKLAKCISVKALWLAQNKAFKKK
jgi:hypothetical protein